MAAWCDGAFERCLELCGAVRGRDARTRTHLGILRARALLRLDRPDEALAALEAVADIPCGTDEALVLRMLRGAALVRQRRIDESLQVLLATWQAASDAHATVRSEIALNVALAYLGKNDLAAAKRFLLRVLPESDIVFARALEYQGWLAVWSSDAERAAAMFLGALDAYDRCRHVDRYLEANCLRALAHHAVELLDASTWRIVEARAACVREWSEPRLLEARFWIGYCAATFAVEVAGDHVAAAREARRAERSAPSDAYRVQLLCKRAAIARAAGEPIAQRDHLEAAVELFDSLDPSELTRDERMVPLTLAEELAAHGWTDRARAAMRTYDAIVRTSSALSSSDLPTTLAYRRLIEGMIVEGEGDIGGAAAAYREAHRLYDGIGYRRRSVDAAIRLARLTRERSLQRFAERATTHASPASWFRREVDALSAQRIQLTDVQREVLVLICQGKSNPEIAQLRQRSLHTIRNLVARLFEVLEVKSREELAVEGVRRGLYVPERRSAAS